MSRARQALREEGVERLTVVGGVAANRRLRAEMAKAAAAEGFEVSFPPIANCAPTTPR